MKRKPNKPKQEPRERPGSWESAADPGGSPGGAGAADNGTSGQSVQKSVRAFLKVLLGLFQTADVENLIELRHHAPDVVGRKPAVLHRVDDVATAGIVAPRLGTA